MGARRGGGVLYLRDRQEGNESEKGSGNVTSGWAEVGEVRKERANAGEEVGGGTHNWQRKHY